MGNILIVAQQQDGKLLSSAAELMTVASRLGGIVEAAVLGTGSRTAAAGLGNLPIARAAVLDGDLPLYSPDGYARALAAHIKANDYEYVLFSNSFFGRDLGARTAAELGAAWLSDVVDVEQEAGLPLFIKPLYAGKVLGRFQFSTAGVKVLTIRPKVFSPAPVAADSTPELSELTLPGELKSRVVSVEPKAEGMVDLKDADIIVSGGRGLGGPEGFEPLREFAKAIGAALGASRATVDAGWIPHSHQVGQTGKVVNPKLYIACGISGAIQHLAGMQTSRCIVAINSNENAPIFKVADYGIVGDVFEVVPELQKQLSVALSR